MHMSGHFRQANTSEDLDQKDDEDNEVSLLAINMVGGHLSLIDHYYDQVKK